MSPAAVSVDEKYRQNKYTRTQGVEVIPVRLSRDPKRILSRPIGWHEVHKVQRRVQKRKVGPVSRFVGRDLDLVENIPVPFLSSRIDRVV